MGFEIEAAKAGLSVLGAAAKMLEATLPTAQGQLDKMATEVYQDIALETQAQLQLLVERLKLTEERVAEITAQMGSRATGVLYLQLRQEAAKSPDPERMRLMCAAIAGVFRPDIELEMKSRVARSVAQLEPSDVLTLRKLASGMSPFEHFVTEGLRVTERLALIQAGCLGTPFGMVGGDTNFEAADRITIYVTEVGNAVSAMCATWQPETPTP